MLIAAHPIGVAGVDRLLDLPPQERHAAVAQLAPEEQQALYLALRYDWRRWARPEQLPPADLDPWDIWVMLAGRAGGKTRPAAELINWWAQHPEEYAGDGGMARFLLVAKDAKQCRDVMVEGESGIVACAPPWFTPTYEPSKSRVVWPRGQALAEMHSAEEPKTLRGPQAHKGWGDEFAAWKAKPGQAPEAWDDGLDKAVRLGSRPQIVLTSTPKQTDFVADLCYGPKVPGSSKRLVTIEQREAGRINDQYGQWRRWHFDISASDGSRERTVVYQWHSQRNTQNVAPGKVAKWVAKYEGTRKGLEELGGEILEKVEGALWVPEWFVRVDECPNLARRAVAVDPTHANEPWDECGVMVGGRGPDGRGYLTKDLTVKGSPDKWARTAIGAYYDSGAHDLVYEATGMSLKLRETIETIDRNVHWVPVPSIQDKLARAQPVSALAEQRRIVHVGAPENFDLLEAELTGWDPKAPGRSPNRLDAYVWLFTALLIGLPREVPVVAPMSITKGAQR